VIVSVAPALRMITLEPNCGYSMAIRPVVSTNGSPYVPLPVPNSVEYSQQAAMMRVGKCSLATYASDPDCATQVPYEIIYDIVFEVTADNDPSTTNRDISMTVEIGNTCLEDYVVI